MSKVILLLPVLSRPRLSELVSPVLPVAQILGPMETTVTPPLSDYLAFPSHERLPFALQTHEDKVVRLPDAPNQGSVLVAPRSIPPILARSTNGSPTISAPRS
jgi:hypothetical protein